MLFRREVLERIKANEVRLAFRRWRKPTVQAGGQLRTAVGVLQIESVDKVSESAISPREAALAGFDSLTDLLAELNRRPEGEIYRVALSWLGDDPRKTLRQSVPMTEEELAIAARELAKVDRGAGWAVEILKAIARQPGTRAIELAEQFQMEKLPFKQRVRRLKELGLTGSLEVGYRLSARGMAVLEYVVRSAGIHAGAPKSS